MMMMYNLKHNVNLVFASVCHVITKEDVSVKFHTTSHATLQVLVLRSTLDPRHHLFPLGIKSI